MSEQFRIEGEEGGISKELVVIEPNGKIIFSENLDLAGSRQIIEHISERLYNIKDLYKDKIDNIDEAKQVIKDLASDMIKKSEIGEADHF